MFLELNATTDFGHLIFSDTEVQVSGPGNWEERRRENKEERREKKIEEEKKRDEEKMRDEEYHDTAFWTMY